jgi:hypothetical protein
VDLSPIKPRSRHRGSEACAHRPKTDRIHVVARPTALLARHSQQKEIELDNGRYRRHEIRPRGFTSNQTESQRRKQRLEVLCRELGRVRVISAQNRVGERGFLLLQRQDFLLDAAGGNEFVHEYGFVLPDAVSAVGCAHRPKTDRIPE